MFDRAEAAPIGVEIHFVSVGWWDAEAGTKEMGHKNTDSFGHVMHLRGIERHTGKRNNVHDVTRAKNDDVLTICAGKCHCRYALCCEGVFGVAAANLCGESHPPKIFVKS